MLGIALLLKDEVVPHFQLLGRLGQIFIQNIAIQCAIHHSIVRDATTKPQITLKELQPVAEIASVKVHESAISEKLHKSNLFGRGPGRIPF